MTRKVRRGAAGEKNGAAKLTWSIVSEIRSAYIPWVVTMRQLADRYGVNPQTICMIISNQTWKTTAEWRRNVKPTLTDRFLRGFDRIPGGCWIWRGNRTVSGYGRLGKSPRVLMHRFSYEHYVGPIPEGMDILHHCDVRPCVNPKHLYAGTDADNVRDKVLRGRHVKGEKAASAKLTLSGVSEIRRRYRAGVRGHGCTVLGKKFGISNVAVHKIISGRSWA